MSDGISIRVREYLEGVIRERLAQTEYQITQDDFRIPLYQAIIDEVARIFLRIQYNTAKISDLTENERKNLLNNPNIKENIDSAINIFLLRKIKQYRNDRRSIIMEFVEYLKTYAD